MDSEAARLEKVLREWNLGEPRLLTRTPTSSLYVVGDAVLKLLTPKGVQDEKAGAIALEYFEGKGAAKILRFDETAQLIELVNGPNALYLPDDKATIVFCDTLKALHSVTKPLPEGLVTLDRRFQTLLSYQGKEPQFLRAIAIAKELLASANNIGVLHGDLHHENILLHPQRGWLAIDPKGVVGEKLFDAANIVFNPIRNPELVMSRVERQCAIICEQMNFDIERFKKFAFAYGMLSALWLQEDGQSPDFPLRVSEKLLNL